MVDKPVGTLVDLLRNRAQEQPDRRAYAFLTEDEEIRFTYADLDAKARELGAHLQKTAMAGERALLLYQPGVDYLIAFFGCLYAGLLAVPAYPPRLNGSLDRLQVIVSDAEATVALTDSAILAKVEGNFAEASGLSALKWVDTDALASVSAEQWERPEINETTLAFLQYTSGSTSQPKGVMLTHGNLLHNLQLIHESFATTAESECVIWLPPYHDMGLIGGILQPLYTGFPVTLMSPFAFMQRPLFWLETISQKGATLSGGPNFAYDLCVQKITPKQKAHLDLSHWKTAFTGAEPVRHETLERFVEAFAECGFTREAFYPCYGLAEATLFVTGGHKSAEPIVQAVQSQALEEHRVITTEAGAAGARMLVGCGHVRSEHQQVLVVDPQSLLPVAAGQVGEIWVAGASVAQGYWKRPELTEAMFRAHLASGAGPFLRTGDLGCWQDGELFISGRLKDLIIIRGRNYYPQDIEYTVQDGHVALRSGCGAAFAVEVDGEERLVIVQEVERAHRKANLEEVMITIREAVAARHELQVYAVVLIKPASAPLTSSGKIQRHVCRERFLNGTLDVLATDGPDSRSEAAAILYRGEESVADAPFGNLSRAELMSLPIEKRNAALEVYLSGQAAQILQMAPGRLDVQKPVTAYGLDSLMAVELKNGIENQYGVVLPLADFLDETSIAQLAAEVLARLVGQQAEAVEPHVSGDQQAFPLSYGQRSLWFLQRLAPQSAAYNIAHAVKVAGDLDVDALRRAFARLAQRHAALRTTFVWEGDQPVQRVQEHLEPQFAVLAASAWSEALLQERLAEAAHEPFDLEKGPLLRVHLFERSAEEHVLLLTVHHIIADFWSLGVLLHELQMIYTAERNGQASHLQPLKASYADHVASQAEMLKSATGAQQEAYWLEQLSGDLPVLQLPTVRPRPPVQTYHGAMCSVKVGAELSGALKALAQREGATLYTVLLAAYQVLLHRYTGQEEIVVGSPSAGRSRSREAGLIGYFVNPLVLRGNLAGKLSFAEFFEQVRQTVRGALTHQEYPFALLVEKLQPQRDPSYPPLFQTMFVLQKSHLPEGEALAAMALNEAGAQMVTGDLPLEVLALEQRAASFDLTLFMAEVGDELVASFEYNSDLFDEATIARMAAHWQTLLAGIVEQPDAPVGELPLLTETETRQLLVEWNDTETAYPTELCIHQPFEAQVERTPDAVAVVFEDGTLTYRELNQQANRVARVLRKRGIGAGQPVGICMKRSLDMMIGLLGVLKAGGAYVPLDPTYPADRLAYVLADADVSVVLTQAALLGLMPAYVPTICVDAARAEWALEESGNLECNTTSAELAYLIYTSGSTGKPKGVKVCHRNALNLFTGLNQVLGCGETDTFLAVSSISFDIAVTELLWTLTTGAKVVILSEQAVLEAAIVSEREQDFSLVEQLQRHQATMFQCTPSLMKLLVDNPKVMQAMRSLRKILLAGEALPVSLVKALQESLAVRVFNGYGPTETTVYATLHEVRDEDSTIPIGRPLPNVQAYILDAHLQPVPLGVAGELYIGGAGVTSGYLNRPELTERAFLRNTFATGTKAVMYKTGDLVRYRTDGAIEYLGRVDHQVKIRGFRIELGEIEMAILQQGSVRETVVTAQPDVRGENRLVAYVVLAEEESTSSGTEQITSDIRRALQEKLSPYMVPSAFVVLDAFPLTPNGKVDRKALPEPGYAQGEREAGGTPRTATEEMLAGIWADVLQRETVDAQATFFELGGHSLLAAQVMSRVYAAFQVDVPLSKLFEHPTVAELSVCIEQALHGADRQKRPIVPMSRSEHVPLSFAQERLWFFEQLQPGAAAYHMPGAVRLKGPLIAERLETCFNEIVRRHEVLRTTFAEVEGQAVGVVRSDVKVSLERIDLRSLSEHEREANVQHLMQAEARKLFDLTKGPLVRTTLLQLAEDEHVLLVTMHHIISDGWSIGVFTREMGAIYEALQDRSAAELPELPVQYADYAHWQREWMSEGGLDKHLAYWKQKLGGSLPVLQAPTDRPRSVMQTFNGATQEWVLSKASLDALKAMSQREGVTLYMTLLAAFQTLLYRYSGQDDIVVGSPIANRTRQEAEALIGFFVNTLALRTDLSGDPPFRELLGRVRQVALEAYAHQDLPFEKLVEELQPERNLSHSAFFQVMLALQNMPEEEMELSGLLLTPLQVESGTAKFDLSLSLQETERGLVGTLEYNTDLFDATTIVRMLGHFEVLLESITRDPEQPISQVPLLTAAEREQMLVRWNDTMGEYPADACLHHLIEAWAMRTPDAIAVAYEGQQLTYAELNRRANRLAHGLRRRGVGHEMRVGICMERSLEQIVSVLGVLKAGAAYLPMDTSYPQERLVFMREDAGVPVILTQERFKGLFAEDAEVEVLCLDEDGVASADLRDVECDRECEDSPQVDVTPDDVAYVIYTSGTTGLPKGVLVPHRGLVNLITDYQNRKSLQPGDAAASWGNFGFDLSVFETFTALACGAQLHLFPDAWRADGEAYFQWLSAHDVRSAYIAPFLMKDLIAWLKRGGSLRLTRIMVGVEPISESLVAEVSRLLPDAVIINAYGPTEATIVATFHTFDPQQGQERNLPIGTPVQNTSVYILDEQLQPVPIGVPGELHVGGIGLASGYLNRPELTAEKFILHSFAGVAEGTEQRLYKTGDLARYLADGTIEFIGRIDHQVKVRGYRIELREIETVLAQHPDVREVVVLASADATGEKSLVAYVVAQENQLTQDRENLSPAELRHFLKDKLPSYMLPSAFVELDEMPLTPNGKVDRRALPTPTQSHWARVEYVAPRTTTEQRVAELFGEVLGVEQVGVYDNFFALGGHSLLATQVVSRIRNAFDIELPLRSLFEAATVAELAPVVEAAIAIAANIANVKGATETQLAQVPFAVLDREAHRIGGEAHRYAYPLSFAQQRLWFLEQLTPGNAAYNIPTAVRLQGHLHHDALERSLQEVVHRHESLQTTFGVIAGQPMQIIDKTMTLTVTRIDLQALSEEEQQRQIAQTMQRESQQAFDLAHGPLLRATLLHVNAEEHVLLLTMHHIISDGWSMGVFIREMTALYEAHLTEEEVTLPEVAIQYADFADWQRRWLAGGELAKQLTYWKEKLSGRLPMLQLPTDRPRKKVQSQNGSSLHLQLPKTLTDALKSLSQQEDVTLYMTLLAAFKTLLYRYTGQEDLLVGSPIANRTREETEGMIGFFVNTLVLRTALEDSLPFRELLKRVREVAFEAYAHQDVPFEKLVEELQPERDLSHTPFFQVMFTLQNAPLGALELPGLSLQPMPMPSTTSKFDLTLSMTETAAGLTGTLEFNSDLFDASTMQRFSDHFQTLLVGIVEQPEHSLGQLPLIREAERRQVLSEWNDTRQDYEREMTLHRLVEKWAEQLPLLPSVVFQERTLTYDELNKRANQLAHRLSQLGVTRGTLVGISMERALEVPVAMLAVLKAGGAYVMFDPTYPQERLNFMLEDSQVPVLLTQQRLLEKWQTDSTTVLCLDTAWAELEQERDDNPHLDVTAEDPAYVIYTSGTTGQPKGSVAHHRGLINLLTEVNNRQPLQPGDRCVVWSNFGFDASVYEIYSTLFGGGTLYLLPEEARLHSESYFQWLQACQIRSSFIPALFLKDFAVWLKEHAQTICLQRLMVGVEPIYEPLLAEIARLVPGLHIINGYGPSETTVIATMYSIDPGSSHERNTPIGKPIQNARIYLLDKHRQPVPIGVAGEIYIGGDGVAYGYLNRPELTAERFVQNPFDPTDAGRLYKTGDLARYLPDGNLEFLGRIDNQIKLRGYRIELGEIESTLKQYPSVRENVVLLREDVPGEKQLVAYVVATTQKPTVSELRQFLQKTLPDSMIPAQFVFLEALPLTPNQKVDRRALPKPEHVRPTLEVAYVAPQTELERQVAAIWQELLQVEKVGLHDNFFELGGHSMLIVQVQRLLRERLGLDITMVQLFEYPTVGRLVEHLQADADSELELLQKSQQRAENRREMRNRRQSRAKQRTVRTQTKGEPFDED